MKKVLLSLLCLVGFIATQATEVTMTFADQGYTNGQEITSVALDENVSLTFDKGTNSNSPKYYNTGTAIRIYGGGTMTVQVGEGVTINSITLTHPSGNNAVNAGSTVSAGTLTIGTTSTTITEINGTTSIFTQGGTSGHVRLTSITVDYTVGTVTSASKPIITPNGGEVAAGTEVTITSGTEGASIYYTLDGTDPSAENGTLYSAPVAINETCTLKAIATAEGLDASEIASADFTVIEPTSFGYVTNVTSGKNYLLVADDTYSATPLDESKTFGYLGYESVSPAEGYIEILSPKAFTVTAVEGGYTIQDSYGRYLYQTGSYNSFNVTTTLPADSTALWTIEPQADGTVKILNVSTQKWIQYSTSYSSYGSYNTETGVMPYLYEEGATAQEKPEVVVVSEVANIAEFIANADLVNAVTITGTVTVVEQAGSYLFIQDESGRMVVYSSSLPAYNKGDQLTGINGTWSPYNGLPQMKPSDAANFGTATAGIAIEPTVMTLDEVILDDLLTYVKIEGVTIPESTSKSYTITDATGSATMYNSAGITVTTGSDLTVYGFISCYNTSVQILPVAIEAKPLYAVGGFNGWDATNMSQFTYANGVYTLELETTSDLGLKISKGNGDWTAIDAGVYGVESAVVSGDTINLVAGKTDNITLPFAGTWTLNVDLANLKFVAIGVKNYAAEIYAIGNVGGANWSTSTGTAIAHTANGVYEGTITIDDSGDGNGYFQFATTLGDSWDVVNSGTRYGALTNNEAIVLGETTSMTNNWAGGTQSWSVAPGEYKATVDVENCTVILTDATGIENIETEENTPAEYYNLQGVKVANPSNGVFIKVQGSKASKVYVK